MKSFPEEKSFWARNDSKRETSFSRTTLGKSNKFIKRFRKTVTSTLGRPQETPLNLNLDPDFNFYIKKKNTNTISEQPTNYFSLGLQKQTFDFSINKKKTANKKDKMLSKRRTKMVFDEIRTVPGTHSRKPTPSRKVRRISISHNSRPRGETPGSSCRKDLLSRTFFDSQNTNLQNLYRPPQTLKFQASRTLYSKIVKKTPKLKIQAMRRRL